MLAREALQHPEQLPAVGAPSGRADADEDGLPDALEDAMARRWAPIIQLAPADKDWTRPASVDWYLKRVRMRLERKWQSDLPILGVGAVTQRTVAEQCIRFGVEGKPLWRRCSNDDSHFFLQPPDDEVHAGAASSEWVTYVHVRKSTAVADGVDLQYWLFWPYNDGFAAANHEADWEQATVIASRSETSAELESVICSQHNGTRRYAPVELELRAGRPVLYCAEGSHALYAAPGAFPIPGLPFGISDHTYSGGPVWDTKVRLVNVGERGHPLDGQHFIEFAGRWGEIGQFQVTSGPRGPAFHASWSR